MAFDFPSSPALGQGYSLNGVDWVYNGYLWRLGTATAPSDTTPNPFTFVDQIDVPLSTPTTSNTITVSGIDATTSISNTGGTYSINGGAFITGASTVVNGDTVTLKLTSSGANSVPISMTLNIGGVTDTFTIMTVAAVGSDTTPNPFTFVDQTGVAVSTPITSNPITVLGINAAAPLTIVGGQYSINGGSFASAATTVLSGNTVAVRVTSSASNLTPVSATLTIGGISDTFTVMTVAAFGPFTLAWTSADTERTNLTFTLTPTLLEADTATLMLSTNLDMSSPFATSAVNTIDAAEAAAGVITFTGITTPIPTGQTYARVSITRPGFTAVNSTVVPKTISGGVVVGATTWDPAQKGADVTLSNGNLTATASAASANHNVRTTTTLGAGKRVVKLTTTDCNFSLIGLCTSAYSPTDGSWLGATASGGAWNTNNGNLIKLGINTAFSSVWNISTVPIWLALEDTGSAINFYLSTNGTSWPVGPVLLPDTYFAGAKKLVFQPFAIGENVTLDANPTFSGLTGALAWSDTGGPPPDTTAPVLSLPTGAQTGTSTATLTVTTDEAGGTLYGVNSSSAPTKAQIKAGQNSTGAASSYAFNQVVAASGVQLKNATGLTPATPYTIHYMHEDVAGNQSNVASASAFTTAADTTAPVLSTPTGVKTGATTATLTVLTNDPTGTLYGVNSAAAPTKAQIKAGQNSTGAASTYAFNQAVTTTGVQTKNATGLTPATSYTMHYMHEDPAGNQSNIASASAFTTDAASTYAGPGDVVSGASFWGGLRAYSNATKGTAAIRIRASGNNAETDIATLSDGTLDVATVAAFLTANGGNAFIAKLYDQSGNGQHLLQATTASQPQLVLSGLGALPVMRFTGAHGLLSTGLIARPQPKSVSVVAKRTGNFSAYGFVYGTDGSFGLYFNNAANAVALYEGGLATQAATDNVMHAIQIAYNGPSSLLCVDNVSTTVNPGNGDPGVVHICLGRHTSAAGDPISGDVCEAGEWLATSITSPQASNLDTNQSVYWGV